MDWVGEMDVKKDGRAKPVRLSSTGNSGFFPEPFSKLHIVGGDDFPIGVASDAYRVISFFPHRDEAFLIEGGMFDGVDYLIGHYEDTAVVQIVDGESFAVNLDEPVVCHAIRNSSRE